MRFADGEGLARGAARGWGGSGDANVPGPSDLRPGWNSGTGRFHSPHPPSDKGTGATQRVMRVKGRRVAGAVHPSLGGTENQAWQALHTLRFWCVSGLVLPESLITDSAKDPGDTESRSSRRGNSSELLCFKEHRPGSGKDNPRNGAKYPQIAALVRDSGLDQEPHNCTIKNK